MTIEKMGGTEGVIFFQNSKKIIVIKQFDYNIKLF